MPREREDYVRESNINPKAKLFILAYEGNKTEPEYFQIIKSHPDFQVDIIEIISLKRKKGDTKNAPQYVFK